MDEEEEVVLDYSLIVVDNFRCSILSSIAQAGSTIEDIYGSAQDVEFMLSKRDLRRDHACSSIIYMKNLFMDGSIYCRT